MPSRAAQLEVQRLRALQEQRMLSGALHPRRHGLPSRSATMGPRTQNMYEIDHRIPQPSVPMHSPAQHERPVMMTKEAVNRSYETTLAEGLRFERRVFHAMFALDDQKEGMAAFTEKRSANFKNR